MSSKRLEICPVTAPRRRWFRFSLRTMLVLIAFVCTPLAFVAREIYEIRAREIWLDRIEKNHHGYMFEDEGHRNFLSPSGTQFVNWLRNGEQHPYMELQAKDGVSIPWLRMRMGYRRIVAIGLKDTSELDEVRRLFPEAETIFWDGAAAHLDR